MKRTSDADGAGSGFSPDKLLALLLEQFPHPRRYCVALSGGMDSTVLLHALATCRSALPAPLAAVHVDHGLQAGSGLWSEHCWRNCESLQLPLSRLSVDASPARGDSPEAAARHARYSAIDSCLGEGDLLLTAHHLDDQAETLLLQLLRGAGVDGLASMPGLSRRDAAWHGRPLLGWSRAALSVWAVDQRLNWVEDPSNAQTAADRNFLRHRVMPLLSDRWPAAERAIARSAGHCAEAAEALREQAEGDLSALLDPVDGRLSLSLLRALHPSRQRRVLRHWLRQHGLPMPPSRRLSEALHQFLEAREDAAPVLPCGDWQLRRFRDALWLVESCELPPPGFRIDWDGRDLALGPGRGRVSRSKGAGGVDPAAWEQGRIQLAYREAGTRCAPVGRYGTRSFKKLVQEAGIPPWQRPLVPVVLIDGRVAAIAGCCVSSEFAVSGSGDGWIVEWHL